MRSMTKAFSVLALLLGASFALAQTEFSAEIYNNQKPEPQAKIYFGKDKMRFESANKDPRQGGAFIVNLATQTSTVIMDQQHLYMDMPQQMANQRMTYNFFRTGDVENACSDWLQLQANKGGSCHKVGSDTVNGRSTVKYEGTNAKGESAYVWLDPKLRFPVKWQGKNNDGGELRNIQEGSQPSSLFEVPAGYKKFDMPNMGNMGGMPQHQ